MMHYRDERKARVFDLTKEDGPEGHQHGDAAPRSSLARGFSRLEHAYETGETVRGLIAREARSRNGFMVTFRGGIRAFLPLRLIDHHRVKDIEAYHDLLGEERDFYVIEFAEDSAHHKNIVVSLIDESEDEPEEEASDYLNQIDVGSVVVGTVHTIKTYGAFLELAPGLDALLHLSEIDWEYVDHPGEFLAPGDQVKVKVASIDRQKSKIAVSRRALIEDPWAGVEKRYRVGDVVDGHVAWIKSYGLLIEVEPGIVGLAHTSELGWGAVDETVLEDGTYEKGEDVRAKVIHVDAEKRRLLLSPRQASENPYQSYLVANPVGAEVTGQVFEVRSDRIGVRLAPEVVGWIPREKGRSKKASPRFGDDIRVRIAGADAKKGTVELESAESAENAPQAEAEPQKPRNGRGKLTLNFGDERSGSATEKPPKASAKPRPSDLGAKLGDTERRAVRRAASTLRASGSVA
ncbi:hypothetical protein CKO28_14160 [Rhodovibrio sodomensis]|uniref:S1 motif domain-containing protein n=1 Tax=Rhodovibrio sodomensis TaxID=1088 RepID=A0ABS1DFC5_9PROT|nr:S1 RNA-binding domain-containing protein [Rhodovibrio sodomensis]MBK1669177.1 hypothetical protein [Rhodovibrio sodomensis]